MNRWKRVAFFAGAGFLTGLVGLGLVIWVAAAQLPTIQSLRAYRPLEASEVLDDRGQRLGLLFEELRLVANDIPDLIKQAFLAAEDASFYRHTGIDYVGILRAAIKNLRPGARLQGASTITQQTVKTLVVGAERSYVRKIREAILAMRLEKILSKDEILELYLNQIYFGSGVHGVRTAALRYFNKELRELDPGEAAYLASIPKNPSRYHLLANPESAKKRQTYVLQQMHEAGWMSAKATQAFIDEPIPKVPENVLENRAPYYLEHVRRMLKERYPDERFLRHGWHISTAADLEAQQAARRFVREGVREVNEKLGATPDATDAAQAALTAIEPSTGFVRALVGGIDSGGRGLNRATQALRQPGSSFKPILYAAALNARAITPITECADSPVVMRDPWTGQAWKPQNYEDGVFDGLITYRRALTRSKNTCSVKLIQKIGVESVHEMARMVGLDRPLPKNATLALGTGEVTLVEMTQAYAAIADSGRHRTPVFVREITDAYNRDIGWAVAASSSEQAIDPAAAYVLTDMMRSVIREGTGRRARVLDRPLAGKTGTSNESRNTWFVGFSPELATGVWVGRDNNEPLGKLTGSSAALPIWIRFMGLALNGRPVSNFPVPEGVVFAQVQDAVGAEPRPEVFIAGTEPSEERPQVLPSIFEEDQ